MTFYHEVLGGELFMQTIGDSPMADQMPGANKDHILHADLKSDDFRLFGSDMTRADAPEIAVGQVDLCLHGDSDGIKATWAKLAKGAEVIEPLTEMFFGMFGSLTDKFGMRWVFQSDPAPEV
jgi:PhnB protein